VREPPHSAAHTENRQFVLGPRRGTRVPPELAGLQLDLWQNTAAARVPAATQPSVTDHHPAPCPAPSGPVVHRVALAEVFSRVFRRLGPWAITPLFKVSFRRFTGLRSAIHTPRRNCIEARLSDLLEDAPPLVIEALAEILITRLFGMRTSREAHECYKAWASSLTVTRRVEEIRRQRGRKRLLPPQGSCFNLKAVFDDLNRSFFGGELGAVRIGWSHNRSRTMLGHYDSSHRTITVTRWLDGRRVPRYVVEYLVFHEMLHARFPVEHHNHRRVVHSKAFRKAEREFPHYNRAIRWLRGIKIDE